MTCAAAYTAVAGEQELVAPGAKVQRLADGFLFTEGPARDAEGNVYFSDIPNNRIHVWSLDGKLTTFREDSGGANGLFFDRRGNLVACEGGNRRLTSIAPDGKATVLADRFLPLLRRRRQLHPPGHLPERRRPTASRLPLRPLLPGRGR